MKAIEKILIALVLAVIAAFISACRETQPIENVAVENANVNVNTTANVVANKTAPIIDKKITKDAKLQAKADSFLPLFKMPSVPVFVKDEPIIKGGSETQKGVGYTTCENKKEPTIYIKKAFFEKANPKMLGNIVKHEMVHAWFCRQGEIIGHNERFRAKFKEVGGIGN